MKKIIPAKFFWGVTLIFLVLFPIGFYLASFMVFYLLTLGNSLVPYQTMYVVLIFGGILELVYVLHPELCKIIIKDGAISNFIFDGTDNDGWRESISNIKKIELVGKSEVQKYYKQFNKSKAILIDFGNYNVKYIYAGLFSKRQINQIINLLKSK